MKILDRLDISGSLNLASNAKDTFTVGTPLEHNDGNVDNFIVYANADFKNNVILGSSSVDTVTINTVLKLTELNPLPAGNAGMLAMSASNLYYHNGSSWSQIN